MTHAYDHGLLNSTCFLTVNRGRVNADTILRRILHINRYAFDHVSGNVNFIRVCLNALYVDRNYCVRFGVINFGRHLLVRATVIRANFVVNCGLRLRILNLRMSLVHARTNDRFVINRLSVGLMINGFVDAIACVSETTCIAAAQDTVRDGRAFPFGCVVVGDLCVNARLVDAIQRIDRTLLRFNVFYKVAAVCIWSAVSCRHVVPSLGDVKRIPVNEDVGAVVHD